MKSNVFTVERSTGPRPRRNLDALGGSGGALWSSSALAWSEGVAEEGEAHHRALGVTLGMRMKMGISYAMAQQCALSLRKPSHRLADRPEGKARAVRGRTDLEVRARASGRRHPGPRESWDITGDHQALLVAARRHLLEEDPTGYGADAGPARHVGRRPR